MTKKTVAFKMPVKPATSDEWVKSVTGPAAVETAVAESNVVDIKPESRATEGPPAAVAVPAEAMKRFTIDVPESLHKRIKSQCALRGVKMADIMREMMEKEFPPN